MEDPSNQENKFRKTTASGVPGNKKSLKPLVVIIPVLAVVFAVIIFYNYLARPYDYTDNTFNNITIEKGCSLEEAAAILQEEGIVGDARSFVIVAKGSFMTNFKPGTYYLSPSMDSIEIAKIMTKGLTTSNGFTIPAGYTVEQIASSLARDGFVDKDKFIKAASSSFFQDLDFIGTDVDGIDQVEGFLLPGDYVVNSNADEAMIVMTMLDNFNNFFNEDYRARADELNMSIREVVIVASVIEQEATVEKERAAISAVLHNRFNIGLENEEDLPEVPLCCPSKESIIAALYPEEQDYTHYVLSSKLDGSHVFTSDDEEYEELVNEYNEALAKRDAARSGEDLNEPEQTEETDQAEQTEEGE